MSAKGSTPSAESSGGGGFRAYWALVALLIGLALGASTGGWPNGPRTAALGIAGFVGTLWLNALKMTVIPLVIALLVVGVAKSREAALGGRIAGRSVVWIVIICTISSVFGAVATVLLTRTFPLARGTASALQGAHEEAEVMFAEAAETAASLGATAIESMALACQSPATRLTALFRFFPNRRPRPKGMS